MHHLYLIVVFAPLLGAILAGLTPLHARVSQFLTCICVAASAIGATILLPEVVANSVVISLGEWVNIGNFVASWALQFDTLSIVMLLVVLWVSLCVHVYSIGYMAHDAGKKRFMSYLSLFTFSMCMLVTSNNFLQLFFGWEGVGLCSYLLIGFWFERERANQASMKAFIVNRVGDVGFLLGIFAVFVTFGTIEFTPLFKEVASGYPTYIYSLDVICLLLFVGAMGKSAQLGLHVWLPDAMEGPTPVSALIHAATMVTAGVFMVARLSPLFELAPLAREVITVIGATTALFAGTIAISQNDIKRVIAYSTCSQLGYMFLACGLSAYNLAIFHLMTHAFFKALLFLGAGSVIHAMSDEQDMQKMGGLWRHVRLTYLLMWVGSLALTGIPFFAGYYSKDAILETSLLMATNGVGKYAYLMAITSVFLTAFYSFRLLFLTFHGASRADERVMSHVHESPLSMTLPMFFLCIGAVFSGWIGYEACMSAAFWGGAIQFTSNLGQQLNELHHHISVLQTHLPLFLTILGAGVAVQFYIRNTILPDKFIKWFPVFYKISYNKWYFDEVYARFFAAPIMKLGRIFWKQGDENTIDKFGPHGCASLSLRGAAILSRLQTGFIYDYALVMLGGIVVIGGGILFGNSLFTLVSNWLTKVVGYK